MIAASIAYEEIARPSYLPATFDAPAGVALRFLSIRALDGVADDAALFEPHGAVAAETTLVLVCHGSGANYHVDPEGPLSMGLAARGFAVLAIDNRAHDAGINTDNFMEIRRDIEAAVAVAKSLGYRRLVLAGHSLGTIHLLFYAAVTWDAAIVAVLLLSPFASLPWKTRNVLVQDDDNYFTLRAQAQEALRAGRADAVLSERMGFYTGGDVPVSARHFITYRDDVTSVANGNSWIARVPYPMLIVRDAADGVILPWEPYELLSSAHAAGSLVPRIEYAVVPHDAAPSLPAHSFVGNAAALLDVVTAYLATL